MRPSGDAQPAQTGDEVIVTYEMTKAEGGTGRNTEILTFSGDQVVGAEVYFGWNPRWIENDLRHATDALEASYQQALTTATELMAYCRTLGMPFGLNVESVSIRKVEIEASVRLAQQLRTELKS